MRKMFTYRVIPMRVFSIDLLFLEKVKDLWELLSCYGEENVSLSILKIEKNIKVKL